MNLYEPLLEQDPQRRSEQTQQLAVAIERMLQSEGWKAYSDFLVAEEARVYAELERNQTAEGALRLSTALTILRRVRTYPETAVKTALTALE